MSAEERRKILQMVADGKISSDEAANLMRALDEPVEAEIEVIEAGPDAGGERSAGHAPEFEEVRRRAQRWSAIPLWVGIVFTVLFAWWMFAVQQNAGLNFWFYCLSLPLLFSIMLIVIGAGSATSRWLYVDVDRTYSKDGDGPRHITIALPLPLGLVAWFLRTFGRYIDGMKDTAVDEVVQAIAVAKHLTEPLIVHVDDSDRGGERVQVFFG